MVIKFIRVNPGDMKDIIYNFKLVYNTNTIHIKSIKLI